jgi:hypothetical protein
MTDPDSGDWMETVTEASHRLQLAGYVGNWYAIDGGRLRCDEFDLEAEPSELIVDEVVRFEGTSDPGDESILYALTAPDGRKGLFSAIYGPDMSPDDVRVVRQLDLSRRSGH